MRSQGSKGGRENARFGFQMISLVALEEDGSQGSRTGEREDSSGPGRMMRARARTLQWE